MSLGTELDLLAQETAGMEKGEQSLDFKTRGALHTQMRTSDNSFHGTFNSSSYERRKKKVHLSKKEKKISKKVAR